jgi:hypothetical protein
MTLAELLERAGIDQDAPNLAEKEGVLDRIARADTEGLIGMLDPASKRMMGIDPGMRTDDLNPGMYDPDRLRTRAAQQWYHTSDTPGIFDSDSLGALMGILAPAAVLGGGLMMGPAAAGGGAPAGAELGHIAASGANFAPAAGTAAASAAPATGYIDMLGNPLTAAPTTSSIATSAPSAASALSSGVLGDLAASLGPKATSSLLGLLATVALTSGGGGSAPQPSGTYIPLRPPRQSGQRVGG